MQFPGKLNFTALAAQDWLLKRRQNLKPWMLFFQASKFKVPNSLPRMTAGAIKNIDNFQSNYLCIFVILIIYCL